MDAENDYYELKKWLEDTKDEPLEGMAAFFDSRIDTYEEHMSQWHKHYIRFADAVPKNTVRLLDIGCGTGLELDRIFENIPGVHVTGIDMAEEMLKKLSEKHPDKNLTIINGDYFLYDFGENRYDAAVSFETLHHYTKDKKSEVFKKIYRALKPGGVYIECDYIAVSQKIEDMVFAESKRRRERDSVSENVFVHFDTPLTAEHETEALYEAGFTKVDMPVFLPGDNHTVMLRAEK